MDSQLKVVILVESAEAIARTILMLSPMCLIVSVLGMTARYRNLDFLILDPNLALNPDKWTWIYFEYVLFIWGIFMGSMIYLIPRVLSMTRIRSWYTMSRRELRDLFFLNLCALPLLTTAAAELRVLWAELTEKELCYAVLQDVVKHGTWIQQIIACLLAIFLGFQGLAMSYVWIIAFTYMSTKCWNLGVVYMYQAMFDMEAGLSVGEIYLHEDNHEAIV